MTSWRLAAWTSKGSRGPSSFSCFRVEHFLGTQTSRSSGVVAFLPNTSRYAENPVAELTVVFREAVTYGRTSHQPLCVVQVARTALKTCLMFLFNLSAYSARAAPAIVKTIFVPF